MAAVPPAADLPERAGPHRLLRRLAALLAAGVLAGCANHHPPRTVPATGPLRVDPPAVAAGDAWTWDLINGYNGERVGRMHEEVLEVGSGEFRTRVSDPTRADDVERRYTRHLGWLAYARPGMDLLTYAPAFPAYDFPLAADGAWSGRVVARDEASERRYGVQVSARVTGWERITVPAGDFDALRIERTVHRDDGDYFRTGTRIEETAWYAPAAGTFVRYENTSRYIDLSSTSRAGPFVVRGDWNVLELRELRRAEPGR